MQSAHHAVNEKSIWDKIKNGFTLKGTIDFEDLHALIGYNCLLLLKQQIFLLL